MIYPRSLRIGIPQNGRRLFGVAACLVFVACGAEQPDDVETRSGAMISNQTMTMVVPAYYSSDSPAWTDFINALPTVSFANAGSMFIIVNGGASEPDSWFDPTLASHIASIRAKGHRVLGYVDWMPKTGPCVGHVPKHDCNGRWAELPYPCTGACIMNYAIDNIGKWTDPSGGNYHLDGFFIDDAQRTDINDIAHAELITNYAQTRITLAYVMFNPGTYYPARALQTYVDCHLQKATWGTKTYWVDRETDYQTLHDDSSGNYTWAAVYSPNHFIQIGYGYGVAPNWTSVDETITKVSWERNAQGFFMTDQSDSSPDGTWGAPARADLFSHVYSNTSTANHNFPGPVFETKQCLPTSCNPNCLTCSCPAPHDAMAGVFVDQNWLYAGEDWDYGYYKATCPYGWGLSGLSDVVGGGTPHAAMCRKSAWLGGSSVATLAVPYDQRRLARTVGGTTDWAPGYWKLECGDNESVFGASQDGNEVFHAVRCGSTSNTTNNGCYTRIFDNQGNQAPDDPDDWDMNYFKGSCRLTEYLAGVSVDPNSWGAHSLLCCPLQ